MSPTPGASARKAGHDWERAIARRWGVNTTRNTRPGVHDDGGDILLPGYLAELKNTAVWRVAPWFAEAEAKASPDQRVALVLKRRHMAEGQALVVITLDTFDTLRGGTT